ncbi:MAG: PIN domain-containing protein [Ornithinimicrobium sp.]
MDKLGPENVADAVIVDTNIFWDDLYLKGSFWRRLMILRSEGFVHIYFPEVVVRELVRHRRRQRRTNLNAVIEKIDALASSDEVLAELGVSVKASSKKELRQRRDDSLSSDSYETLLRETICEVAEILALPSLDADEMFTAYLAGKKPFKEGGTGVADYMIWQTVRQYAESVAGHTVLLLTENHKDFAQNGELHTDLRTTLANAASRVDVCLGVDEFLRAYTDKFDYIESTNEMDYSESSESLSMSAAVSYVEHELVGTEISWFDTEPYPSGLQIAGFGLPSGIESTSVEWVELDVGTGAWHPYEDFDETTELGLLECEGDLTIVGYAYRSEALILAESQEVDSVDFASLDDHYAEVRLSLRVTLRFNVRVERDYRADVEHLDAISLA